MSYVANLPAFTRHDPEQRGLQSLGVQVLTIEDITIQIMTDPLLRVTLESNFRDQVMEMLEDPLETKHWYTVFWACVDLKYMGKPAALPVITRDTDFADYLIRTMDLF